LDFCLCVFSARMDFAFDGTEKGERCGPLKAEQLLVDMVG
jgi:hypothetical protein